MPSQTEMINYAVAELLKAVTFAVAWSAKSRKRSLEAIAKMDIDEKTKEIIFLTDKVELLEKQVKY